jgi:glycosyltransferase involved in cell wall biosynthesis
MNDSPVVGTSKHNLAFIIPTLNASAAQDEDTVQLLLYAAARMDRLVAGSSPVHVTAMILSLGQDTSGWDKLSSFFSARSLKHVQIEAVKEPLTPSLAIPAHKSAYNVYEFLKQRSFSEVHCLDRYGLVYYPTQAKHLGTFFLNTAFYVHVVGGTIFRRECQDLLLDDADFLASDLLERGSLERADILYIHDDKAWRWYEHKIVTNPVTKIYDVACPESRSTSTAATIESASSIPAVIYFGPLGADGGLPVFCDAVDCLVSRDQRPAEVIFVGAAQAIGGIDAVTYIRLRSAAWRVPTIIKRDLSIADEAAFLAAQKGVVVCNSLRREHLRSRLLPSLHPRTLHIGSSPFLQHTPEGENGCPTPRQLADAMRRLLEGPECPLRTSDLSLASLWSASRSLPVDEGITPQSPPLKLPGKEQPRVSVCITHFSRPQKLRTALESLKRQTYHNFEVIVVDDGSPAPEVQHELALIREDIEPLGWRVLLQDNRYLGAARNFGARHATGDYLIFMDDDNVAKPHEISTFVAVAQRTGADITTAFCDVFEDETTLQENGPPPLRFTPYGSDPALGIFTNCFGDANALYSRRAFDKLGGFTEDYGITHEDWELFCRASLEGFMIQCIPEPLFWYRMDQNAMFRGQRTQLHKSANLRRHIRPYLEKLPHYQANLVQLLQGLTTTLPLTTVGASSRAVAPLVLRKPDTPLPYGRVGVVMRTKDRPLLLRRAIRSVLSQTFKDWVLVIVNDGGSPELLETVIHEVSDELGDRVLTVHHPVSLGMQSASNSGITHCDSDFVVIHDDDDSWDPSFLARTVSYLDDRSWNARLGGVITWSWVIVEELSDDGAIKVHNRFVFNDKLYNVALIDLAVENRFPPISFLFKRAALDSVGPFKAQHGPLGDWEFHLRLLQRFDIDVIPDPLANYHHRTNTTTGVYGNSVHAQKDQHQSSRIDWMNHALRDELGSSRGLSLAQLLTLGELQHTSRAEQAREFQRLHDYVWTIDQRIQHIASQVQRSSKSGRRRSRRNLTSNGDFRQWPGLGGLNTGPGDTYYFKNICPGFILCYDGRQASYRIEQRKWTTDGQQLPFGKTFLHIENDGYTKGSSWFVVECTISSALLLSGRSIAISGISRLNAIQSWLTISGRYHLGDGRQLSWPETRLAVSSDFSRWSCSLVCPAIQDTEVRPGHNSRILLKLPHNQPFDFDLTDFQVELGTHASDFEYCSALSLRHTFGMAWERVKRKLRTVKNAFN